MQAFAAAGLCLQRTCHRSQRKKRLDLLVKGCNCRKQLWLVRF